jgi:MINDY deubiquitinase
VPASPGAGGELALFLLSGIPLVHGWLVDPDSAAARAMMEEGTEDYDSAVALIAEADHLTGGMLVQVEEEVREGEAGPSNGGSAINGGHGHRRNGKGQRDARTQEERRKVRNGKYCFYCSFVSLTI